jgi:creatinine amidohydrolase
MNHILPTATTSDEKQRNAECTVLPVGSFEQHGDYLPLITDTVIASVISRELASTYPLLQLPPITISCSHEHSAWRGTVSISSSTLHSVIDDVYRSITDADLTSLVIVNCHGGNYSLANVVQEANAHGKKMVLFPSGRGWADARQSADPGNECLTALPGFVKTYLALASLVNEYAGQPCSTMINRA